MAYSGRAMESASRVDAQPTGRQRRGAAAAAAIEPRLLVVRHARYQHQFYDILSWWIARFAPQFQGLLDIRNLPFELPPDTRRGAPWGALVAWLQDPVENWSMRT